MATRNYIATDLGVNKGTSVVWTGIAGATADEGEAFDCRGFKSVSIQIERTTAGSAGTCDIRGRLDTTLSYVTLVDPQGNPISKSANDIEENLTNVAFISPISASGDRVFTVALLCKK